MTRNRPQKNSARLQRLASIYHRLKTALIYRPLFCSLGPRTRIIKPMMLMNTEFARIGIGVTIRNGARLECVRGDSSIEPSLSIGDFTHIEQNAHIVCRHSVRIGHHVSIAANCAIVDVHHPYKDVQNSAPIGLRTDEIIRPVEIGDYSFIGMFCVILPGTKIGRHCVIGAGSIVTRDIPDYCVASGSPARVIKTYDPMTGIWVRLTEER